ncbi:hypothetical protein BW730_05935 [Tessaracoccus aquimaris]|uniref:Integrase catalytic domain-containing protein n=1 Tax=Tessaracoccus aquimaris TaxID=1332264 RepID=A0A1Q2CLX6_9ACTN|nr:integrase core domain-containing protein [Tessaracoccus aquimaris]AQP47124.1 hypothetical protein BW730_05935 [Tessaracoccus aquimaris]
MSHANAALTPRARLTVARLVVEQGVPVSEVAARFQCSWATVKRWADRYLAGWFAARGVKVERVLSDNGAAYKSNLWHQVCSQFGITVKKTRPYRPQTNGKIERFHRTLADGWGYARCYQSETERRDALAGWLHHYNHHRPHTACGNLSPITRLTNVPDQYS